jgi:hypothetical protein
MTIVPNGRVRWAAVSADAWAYSPLAVFSPLYTDAIPVCGVAASDGEDEIAAAIKIPIPKAVMRLAFTL